MDQSKRPVRVLLANPRGFCAGVDRAIDIVEKALEMYGPPVYMRHEIVHNRYVVDKLQEKGARFVEEIDEVPEGAVAIFSAHGVSSRVVEGAAERGLRVIDATCPLVSKVHKEGQRYASKDVEVVLIGHKGHPEVEGTMGQIPGKVHLVTCVEDVALLAPADPGKLAYVTQTTLSVDDTRDVITALKDRFPAIQGPDVKDICYATQNRQSAVRELADISDVVLVVGAQNSSNSNRLAEIGMMRDVPSYLIDDASQLRKEWFDHARTIGITAGASAPEELVQGIVVHLGELFDLEVKEMAGVEETIHFPLPIELSERDKSSVPLSGAASRE